MKKEVQEYVKQSDVKRIETLSNLFNKIEAKSENLDIKISSVGIWKEYAGKPQIEIQFFANSKNNKAVVGVDVHSTSIDAACDYIGTRSETTWTGCPLTEIETTTNYYCTSIDHNGYTNSKDVLKAILKSLPQAKANLVKAVKQKIQQAKRLKESKAIEQQQTKKAKEVAKELIVKLDKKKKNA